MGAERLVGYVSDPAGRGTYSLVISCLLTLVLCVWSALHLNVPPPNQSTLRSLWLSVRWIVTGVYAPELVVFTAWRQWSSARILSRIVREETRDRRSSKHSDRIDSTDSIWTPVHSFFASTGGFAFAFDDTEGLGADDLQDNNIKDSYMSVSQGSIRRATITARGMALLAKCGHLPNIPEGDIADKSKANNLAKFLVILQASWMLLQVLGRLIARLPITLLELNTVAHVLCAFLMYAMWWNKPLTAKEPIILRGPWVDELLAFMYMSSDMSGRIDEKGMRSKTIIKTLFASLHLYSKQPEVESVCYSRVATPGIQAEHSFPQLELTFSHTSLPESTPHNHQTSLPLPTGPRFQLAPRRCATLLKATQNKKEAGTAFFERRPRVNAVRSMTASRPSLITLHRWELAAQALERYPEALADTISFTHNSGTGPCIHYKPQQLVTPYSRNWPGDDLLRDVGGLVVGMILWLANLLYGGIHAAAWNEHFPSVAEKWFWRASASYIGFCGGLWVVLNFVVSSTPWLNDFWEKWMDGEKKWWHNVMLGTLVFVCGLSLMIARAYIVIEAFLSIRELPVQAYETPSWAQIFPHL